MAGRFLKQNAAERRDLILHGPISTTIMLLSVPTLLMGIVQSVIPIVDGLFINNIAGTVAASAVYYSAPLIGIFGALAQGLSLAGMAVIGHAFGKGDYAGVRQVITQLFALAVVSSLVIAPFLVLAAFPVSAGVNQEIAAAVFTYVALNALILPLTFISAIYHAVKNAVGRPEDTFVRILVLLVFKVIFNVLFIGILRWGLVGAIMSTLGSSSIICIWIYYEMFMKSGPERLSLAHFRFDRTILRHLRYVGIPAVISSLILNLGFFLINIEIQKYGAVVLTGSGIASNISNLCFLLPSSYGSAVTTLVSMNIGAGQGSRARRSCLVGVIISAVTAVLLIALVVPLAPRLTELFTRQQEVLDVANDALSIYLYAVVGFGICMILQGAYVGLGRTRIIILFSALRIWLLRYLFILLAEGYLGYHAVFWGNLFSNYVTAVIIVILILRVQWVSTLQPGLKT